MMVTTGDRIAVIILLLMPVLLAVYFYFDSRRMLRKTSQVRFPDKSDWISPSEYRKLHERLANCYTRRLEDRLRIQSPNARIILNTPLENIVDEIRQRVYIKNYELKPCHDQGKLPYIQWWIPHDIHEEYSYSHKLGRWTSDMMSIIVELTKEYLRDTCPKMKIHIKSVRLETSDVDPDGARGYIYLVKFDYVHMHNNGYMEAHEEDDT